MNNLIEFLTSKEIIVVYIVAAIACFLCFIIYIIDKNYYKRKQRHNTKELNKLVEDVNVRLEENHQEVKPEEVTISTIEQAVEQEENIPVLEPIIIEEINTPEILEKEELPKITIEEQKVEKVEDIILETMAPEPENNIVTEELMYTDVEPNKEEAQLELQRLTEELEKAEQETKNIDLTAYEEEQEENAIISLEELVRKSKEMYAANELTQYEDEGNEPISLQDLELRIQQAEQDEPVIIEQITEETKEPHQERMVLDDFNNIKLEESPVESQKPAYQTTKKFHSSPVISPIYGIEKKDSSTDIELENTANYEKLDEEIKKTNEFLMTLRELQKHLD